MPDLMKLTPTYPVEACASEPLYPGILDLVLARCESVVLGEELMGGTMLYGRAEIVDKLIRVIQSRDSSMDMWRSETGRPTFEKLVEQSQMPKHQCTQWKAGFEKGIDILQNNSDDADFFLSYVTWDKIFSLAILPYITYGFINTIIKKQSLNIHLHKLHLSSLFHILIFFLLSPFSIRPIRSPQFLLGTLLFNLHHVLLVVMPNPLPLNTWKVNPQNPILQLSLNTFNHHPMRNQHLPLKRPQMTPSLHNK
ncbi:hypothetical protein BBP40_011084 [Aspergillus hancockii]|nr:hypothetical protein BBP40_011084 [Aspergillus hancockii]